MGSFSNCKTFISHSYGFCIDHCNAGRLLFMDPTSKAKEQYGENPLESLEPITRQSGSPEQPLEA